MKDLVQQFLIIAIIIYCIHMIYYYFRNRSKKYKNIPTVEMSFLMRVYNIDVSKISLNIVQKHISLINSVIISIDLLLYYNIGNAIIKLFIVFVATFLLVLVFYSILGLIYKKKMY